MNNRWTTIIKPKVKLLDINLMELWKYKDLIIMFVKRDFKTLYKQTILGPLWIIINPMLTTLMFTVVFGGIANISTDGIPQFVFYMAGNTIWSYFSTCLTKTANTFISNSAVFGKVYFPRLVSPISTVLSGLINFFVQFAIFLCFVLFYSCIGNAVRPNIYILLTPILLLMIAMLSLGFGIIVSSLTTKYRDLSILITFGVQLWMYATPVVYPISQIPFYWRNIMLLNPVAPIIETFRYAFLGSGTIPWFYLGISAIVTILILFIGVVLFNKVQKTFMDTI